MMHARRVLLIVGASVLLVALETAIFWFALDHELVGIAMLYLPGVVVMTLQLGFPASLLTSGLSVAAYDYFFTAPYFSFAVRDSRSVLTFVIMVFVAFVIGRLTARIRRDATEATEREQRTASLYALSRALEELSGSGGRAIIGDLEGVLGAFLDLIEVDVGWERAEESAAGASVGALEHLVVRFP